MTFTRRQCLISLGASVSLAADKTLSRQWQQIAAQTGGTVGASALHFASGQAASLHGGDRFPMASVCKFPIALHILAMVDEGKLALDREIAIPPYDLVPGV